MELTKFSVAVVGLIAASSGVIAEPPAFGATVKVESHHSISLEDLVSLRFPDVTEDISPDGRSIAYALSNNDLFVSPVDSPRPVRIAAGFLPRWSPDGLQLAYYSVTGGGIQLFVYNVRTGSATQLTKFAGGIDPDPNTRVGGFVHDAFLFDWSPDGASLAFVSRPSLSNSIPSERAADPADGNSHMIPLVLTNDTPADWTLSGIFNHPVSSVGLETSPDGHSVAAVKNRDASIPRVNQLFVADLQTKRVRQLTHDDTGCFNPNWSAAAGITCAAPAKAGPILGQNEIGLYSVDSASGDKRPLVIGPGVRSRPRWSPNGYWLAYFEKLGFFSKPSLLITAKGGHVVNLGHALDRVIQDYCWLSGDSVAVTYYDGVSVKVTKVSLNRGTAGAANRPSISPALSSSTSLSCSKSGSLSWVQADPVHLGAIMLSANKSLRPTQLIDLYPQTRAWELGHIRLVRWRNSSGDLWEGSLLLPPDFQRNRRYPVIVDVYPLIGGAAGWTSPMYGNEAMAAQGYVIFRPSEPAPHVWVNYWKSPKENLKWRGPNGWTYTLDDILTGIDYLSRRGIIDKHRMCLYGFSNGGGVVNYMLTKTHVFRCAVSVSGALSDWIRPSLLQPGYAEYYEYWAGVSIWKDPDAYVELSPVMHTSRVTTPTLLADGDNDGDFLLDTIEMYNGLRAAGDHVVFLRYPGQGHGFEGAALQDFWNREMAFFRKYLRM